MSRCTVQMDKVKYPHYSMVVGLDPPMSCWFFQVYDDRVGVGDGPCGKCNTVDCDCDEVVAWEPVIRSNGELMEHMQKWGVDLSDPYTKEVYGYIAMDLDPGEVKRPA